jgi:hypothetical protein
MPSKATVTVTIPAKRARNSRTILTFASALTAAIVSLIMHYTGALVLPAEALGGALTTAVASIVAVLLRLRTGAPIVRSKRNTTPPSTWLVMILLPLSFGWISCGAGVWEATSEKAGWCMARCAAGCAGEWVGDLLGGAGIQVADAYGETGDPQVIRDGSRLYLHVEGPDGAPVVYTGRLQGPKLISGSLRGGYFVADDGGPAQIVPLSPEPRLYCASLTRMEGAKDAPPGYVPADPPESREEFVERFGELPAW